MVGSEGSKIFHILCLWESIFVSLEKIFIFEVFVDHFMGKTIFFFFQTGKDVDKD